MSCVCVCVCVCVCSYLMKPVSRASLREVLPFALQQEEAGPSIDETTEGEPERTKTGRPTSEREAEQSHKEDEQPHDPQQGQRQEIPEESTLLPEQPSQHRAEQYERQPQLNDPPTQHSTSANARAQEIHEQE